MPSWEAKLQFVPRMANQCANFLAKLSSSFTDTITATNFLKDPSSLTSDNGVFKLGFIAPPGSTNRYVAIWYDKVSQEIVWVANRNLPLTDSSGELKISKDGNIELLNSDNRSIWSSSMADSSAGSTARLLNSGNFVLMEPKSGTVVWQSFDHPVDSFLPGMKLTFTKNPNSTSLIFLRSWKSNSDPSEGRFSVGIDTFPVPQIVIWEEGRISPHWRSGPWNGNMFIGIEDNINFGGGVSAGFILATDKRATMSLSFTYSDGSSASFLSKYTLNPQGTLVLQWWDATNKNWEVSWNAPTSNCDAYNHCGPFASCNPISSEACKCFRGFEPKNKAEWSRGNWTNGCLRRTKLQCGSNGDGFWTMNNVKVPDKADWVLGLSNDECRGQCLSNCSCLACMYDTGVGCLWWSRDLIDTVKISDGGGLDLNARLASSDLQEGQNGKVKIIAAISGVLGIIVLAVFVYIFWRRMSRKQGHRLNWQKAWGLWNENKLESLIDPKIAKTCIQEEFLKCARVGLLCVQDLAADRPSISRVLFYLGSENADIPSPKPPGFILRGKNAYLVEGSTSQSGQQHMQSSSYSVYEDETTLIPR
ncbi:hypothetical protein V2J09_010084 [Rumex salicifolius]